MFVTTTTIDFARLFRRPEMRDLVMKALFEECLFHAAALDSYVVMEHHLHAIIRAPEGKSMSWFIQRFKTATSALINPILTVDERAQMSQQVGLNCRSVWKEGFRGKEVISETFMAQKRQYIHLNPVRAGFVERAEDYPWSSAKDIVGGYWAWERGLDLEALLSQLT